MASSSPAAVAPQAPHRWRDLWGNLSELPISCWLASLLGGLPAVLCCLYFLAVTDTPFPLRWYCGVFVCASWLLATFGIRSILESHLLLLDASLQSYLEGDYSCRLTVRSHHSLLSRVLRQCNDIGELLRKERLFATEANALVQKIVQEMDVAVLAFDSQDKVSLVNRAAERLLALPQARLLGLSTQDPLLLNLRSGTAGNHSRRLKFSEHRFYVDGKPHSLWTASDLTVALRDEERSAWQKLIRVLTHEIKNSLTPMQTLSQHLIESLDEPGWTENVKKALPILARRAAGLVKFIGGYAQLARLPAPTLSPVSLPALLDRVVALASSERVQLRPGPRIEIRADEPQLEQALINLIRNATESTPSATVEISWQALPAELILSIRDTGPGLSGTENLFVPFFTTKENGSGIGLVLSRQIIEAHSGSLQLRNRTDSPGCEALIRLPR